MTILIAVGDCFEAFLAAPVVGALRARGAAVRVAAVGATAEQAALRTLLGPDAEVNTAATGDDVALAARQLVAARPQTIAVLGRSRIARAMARFGGHARLVQLDAGALAYGVDAAEPGASLFCAPDEAARLGLLRAGWPASSIRVVGDLVAAAVAAAPKAPDRQPGGIAFAFEHADGPPPAWPGMLAQLDLRLRSAMPPDANERAWFDHAATADVLLTDSVGWQRVAMALGVPCIVAPTGGLWPPGVAEGRVTQVGYERGPFVSALRRLLREGRRPPSAASPDVFTRVVDALLAPDDARAPVTLPSDGDASGRTFTNDEAALVSLVLQRGTLNSTRGTMVTAFEKRFAAWLGRKHAIACASGSAAVHCAIAALKLQPGDEVVTTPITDMGALTPILYEGAVPVFADVDPVTLNVTADALRAQLTDRTRAIVVTHLFGNPCDLDAIGALARDRGVPLIEDAAQAFGATWRDRKVGTFGALGTFSLQQGKHITTGEGGIVATDDDELARRVFLYVNKAWGYGDKQPDHYFPALNYRLTELQGAVAVAQLPKLDGVVEARRAVAAALRDALADVRGLVLPGDPAHGTHSWWKFAFHVDPKVVVGGAPALGKQLQASGVACVPRYIQKPAFECALFRDWNASPVTSLPLQHSPRRERAGAMFARADYPGALRGLDTVVVLPINERYLPVHVEHVANAIRNAVGALRHG